MAGRESREFAPRDLTHLFIDLDGTLLGNKRVKLSLSFARRSLKTLHEYGGFRRITRALLSVARELKHPTSELANDARAVEKFAKAMKLGAKEAEVAMKNSLDVVFPTLDKYFFPLDGAPEFLAWAAKRYTLVLATNPVWPREIIELRVHWAGIDPALFSFVSDSHQMTACKPDPRYFRQLLKLTGASAEHSLFIGNETGMDLPATRVGIPVFLVKREKRLKFLRQPKTRAAAARGTFAQLKDLLAD